MFLFLRFLWLRRLLQGLRGQLFFRGRFFVVGFAVGLAIGLAVGLVVGGGCCLRPPVFRVLWRLCRRFCGVFVRVWRRMLVVCGDGLLVRRKFFANGFGCFIYVDVLLLQKIFHGFGNWPDDKTTVS